MTDYEFKFPETIFLENKTGQEIVDEQNNINSTADKRIIATQIFERKDNRVEQGKTHKLYDAFIYIKRKFKTKIDMTDITK